MNLPPFVYSLNFWNSLSILVAAAAVQFNLLPLADAAKLLAAVLAVLNLFNIVPELRAKGRIR